MTEEEKCIVGQSSSHLVELPTTSIQIHRSILNPFKKMQEAASNAGFGLQIVSGFRSFESQLRIWNAKAQGKRAVLDSNSKKIDLLKLPPKDRVFAILRWSALPGASRHHWGTDFDFYDQKNLPDGYQIQLVDEEYEGKGPFAPLANWLDDHLSNFGFFRPYSEDLGGVSPERWHVSHAAISNLCFSQFSIELLREVIEGAEIELKEEILSNLSTIYKTFVMNISN